MKKSNSVLYSLLILFLCSCIDDSPLKTTLEKAHSIIEEHPDSSLAILQGIDIRALDSKALKADYSLLMSTALDKNYIDIRDFSVLQPALDYYPRRGTATQKLKTFYYQGVIYNNQGDIASAVMSFKKALKEGDASEDLLCKGKAHVALGEMYSQLYHHNEYADNNIKAAEYFKAAGDWNRYYNCLLRILNGAAIIQDYDLGNKYIEECKLYLDKFDNSQLCAFYSSYIAVSPHGKESNKNMTQIYEDYISRIPPEYHNPLSIAHMQYHMGNYNSALEILTTDTLSRDYNYAEKQSYYALLSSVNEKMNNYQEGWEAEKAFRHIEDSLSYTIYHHDVLFLEEQHKAEIQNLKEEELKNRILYTTIAGIIILLFIILLIYNRLKARTVEKALLKQELQRYKLQYQQIVSEKDNLTELLEQDRTLDKEIESALTSRISLLNRFLKDYIIHDGEIDRKLDREMTDLINDREKFVESNRLSFAGSHPEFIEYLKSRELTDWEIGYCCLYALGLKGKDIGTYINLPSHYNQSSAIRKKLGISEHETNLGIYINQLINYPT